MYYYLCRVYGGRDGSSKENEASKPSNGVIREHERSQLKKSLATQRRPSYQ